MEFGVQTRGPYVNTLEVSQWADRRGLACFAMPDHYMTSRSDTARPAYDNLAMLAGLARDTTTIRLASLVSPVTFRHPAVMAKNAVTIDEMSGGRFTLGVGTGWLEREHEIYGLPFYTSAERWERMEETLAYLEAAFAPEPTGFAGKHYTLEAVPTGPQPSDGLQIVIGGTGPLRTPQLAGRYAHEYNTARPEQGDALRQRIDVARTAAAAASRDPEALLISCSSVAIVGSDERAYRRSLATTAELLEQSPEEIEEALDRRGTPHGTPDQAAELMGRLEEAGVQRFYVQAVEDRDADAFEEVVSLLGG